MRGASPSTSPPCTLDNNPLAGPASELADRRTRHRRTETTRAREQERHRETGRVSNTSYSHTMRNNEQIDENLSEDSETNSSDEGAPKESSTIVNARVPAIADPHKTRRVRDKRGSTDAGKFSTSTPKETKIDSRFFKNKKVRKSFSLNSLNCFSRDPSESPDDVTEIVINSSNISGAGKVKPRAHSRVQTSDSEGYELSKEEQKKIRKMRKRKER